MEGATTTTVLHLEANAPSEGFCGDSKVQTTPDPASVTCRRCIARMGGVATVESGAVATRLVGRRAHTLARSEERLVERSKAGEELRDGPRWDSLAKAAEHWARVIDDGAPIRTAFRIETVQSSFAGGDRGVGGREDVLAFTLALEHAFVAPRYFPGVELSIDAQRRILEWRLCGRPVARSSAPWVSRRVEVARLDDDMLLERAIAIGIADDPRRVYAVAAARELARLTGAPVTERDVRLVEESEAALTFEVTTLSGERPRGRIAREAITAADLVDELHRELGLALTVHQVGVVFRDGMRAMRERLEAQGELRPMRRPPQNTEAARKGAEDTMAIGEWDLEGWAEIAEAVGRGTRSCQDYAAREEDPLPVRFLLGRVVAKRAEITAWISAQARTRSEAHR